MSKLFQNKPNIWGLIRLYRPYILFAVIVFLLFLHIFNLIFGEKSFIVLSDLQEQKKELEASVKFYQMQNTYLNKEILEIRGVK